MSLSSAIPGNLIRDAIACVASDGQLQPATDTMREWMVRVASHLDQLPLSDHERAALLGQEVVVLRWQDAVWELRLTEQDGVRWLLVHDVTDREAHIAGSLAAARCRWLGASASTLAHDLNNQFIAALALSSTLARAVEDEDDRKTIVELERGTRVGMRMVTSLARLLICRGSLRDRIDPADVLEDALSVIRKNVYLASIELEVEVAKGLPKVRVLHVEAVQAVLSGLVAMQLTLPKKIRCELSTVAMSVGGGRQRSCVVLRCHAEGVSAAEVEPVVAVVQGSTGKWTHIRNRPDDLEGLAVAVFIQQRLGGDLRAKFEGDSLRLDYIWPAANRQL